MEPWNKLITTRHINTRGYRILHFKQMSKAQQQIKKIPINVHIQLTK